MFKLSKLHCDVHPLPSLDPHSHHLALFVQLAVSLFDWHILHQSVKKTTGQVTEAIVLNYNILYFRNQPSN